MTLNKFKHLFAPGMLAALLLAMLPGSSYAGDIVNGEKLYARYCASCHGTDGVNIMPDAPNFANSEKLLRPDQFILSSIKEGINAMPSFQGMLKDQEILDIISYLRTLENGGPVKP